MWLIITALSLEFARHGIIFPFIPLMAEEMGASPTTIGFIVGAFSLIAVFLSVPLGGLIDRFGVKRLLLFGVICNITNAGILVQTDTISMLIVAQFVAGIAFLLHLVASQAFISRLSDASQREKGFAWLSFAGAAGQSVGPVLGGTIVDRFDYQVVFWVALILSSCGLIILGLKDNPVPNSMRLSYNPIQDARRAVTLAVDPRVSMILIFAFAVVFAANLQASFLPVLLRTEGLTEFIVGILISVFAVTATSIRVIFIKLLDMFNRKKLLAYSILAIILALVLIPSMTSEVGFVIAISIFGLGFGTAQPLSMIMIADLTHPIHSGVAMGLRLTAIMLAGLLSPIFLGLIIETLGLGSAFYVAALVVVIAGVRMLIIRPDLIPDRKP